MRRRWWAVATVAVTAATLAMAVEIDFSDFDDALMRDMDDAIKDLDSNLGGQDASASRANVDVLRNGLAWAEKYFAAKPEAPRGAGLAREAQEHLALVTQSLDAGNFDAAMTGVRGVVRGCKSCHDAYKPPE